MTDDDWAACLVRYEQRLRAVEDALQHAHLDDAGLASLAALAAFAPGAGLGPLPPAHEATARALLARVQDVHGRAAHVQALVAEAMRRAPQPGARPAAVFVDESL